MAANCQSSEKSKNESLLQASTQLGYLIADFDNLEPGQIAIVCKAVAFDLRKIEDVTVQHIANDLMNTAKNLDMLREQKKYSKIKEFFV